MDHKQFARYLHAVAEAFENHWDRNQRVNPKDYPAEMSEDDWWDQWEAFCDSFDLEAKDGD